MQTGNEDWIGQALTLDDTLSPLRDRDRFLASLLAEVLREHDVFRAMDLRYVVSGGVVHLRGIVPSEDAARRLRAVIGRIRGIHAVWDTLIVPGQHPLRIIDIGCGTHKQISWATGVDKHALPGVDVVTDLDAGLPFGSDEIDQAYAIHVLEHVRDLVFMMNEIHRCLRPGGVLHIMVPNCSSPNAIADPTHVRLFNRRSFKYFCRPMPDVRPFRPLIVSGDDDNLLADLQPVKGTEKVPDDAELSGYFE